MSILVPFNGSTFIIPTPNEIGWGTNLDNYFVAIANGCLQNIGGNFTLSNDADFGGTNGLKSLYYKSRSSNIASTGIVRLANNGDSIAWRNAANSANHELTVNNSDQICFDGTPLAVGGSGTVNTGTQYQLAYYATSANAVNGLTLITANKALQSDSNGLPVASTVTNTELGYVSGVTSAIQTQLNAKSSSSLTSAHLFIGNGSNVATDTAVTGDITITNVGVTSISAGVILNASINASAAIALTKLAATTVSRALVSDGSGFITAATTTTTEIGFVNGVTSSIQTQINTKAPSASPTFTGTIGTPLAANAVVKTDGSSNLTTGSVSLGSQVSGTLPVANGGTNVTTKLMAIDTYTGNGTSQSPSHSLGTTPTTVIVLRTDAGAIPCIWVTAIGAGASHDFNGTRQTNEITAVGSTTITVGVNASVNTNGASYTILTYRAQ